jgi:hypothetical protein
VTVARSGPEEEASESATSGGTRADAARRLGVAALLGVMTIVVYGATFYLMAVLAPAVVAETGWPLSLVVGGLSVGLLVSGLVSPWVGRRIERGGGRAILPHGCLVMAAGSVLLALADSLWFYAAAWIVLGVAMGCTYYQAAFATLGRQFGQRARGLITALTLVAGFSSTLCWPLSAALVHWLDWRGTCLVYAAALVATAAAVHFFLPAPPPLPAPPSSGTADADPTRKPSGTPVWILVLLGLCFAISSTITAVVSVHLVALLGARGIGLAAAVAIGTLIGPSQVGSRALEFLIGRSVHPLWTLVVSGALMALGLMLLALGWGWIALAFVLYGGGVGLRSIVSGTVPLVLVGPRGYATVMGKLAAPSLVMQALAPVGAAELLSNGGSGGDVLLWILAGSAAFNLLLAVVLLRAGRQRRG